MNNYDTYTTDINNTSLSAPRLDEDWEIRIPAGSKMEYVPRSFNLVDVKRMRKIRELNRILGHITR